MELSVFVPIASGPVIGHHWKEFRFLADIKLTDSSMHVFWHMWV